MTPIQTESVCLHVWTGLSLSYMKKQKAEQSSSNGPEVWFTLTLCRLHSKYKIFYLSVYLNIVKTHELTQPQHLTMSASNDIHVNSHIALY